MKALLFAVVAAVTVSASADKIVTVRVCDGEMHGEGPRCRVVTYKVRTGKGTNTNVDQCSNGDSAIPCYAKKSGVPAWLRKLNSMFPQPSNEVPVNGPGSDYSRAGGQ